MSVNSTFAYYTRCYGDCVPDGLEYVYREGDIVCSYAYSDDYCEFGNIPFCPGYTTYSTGTWVCGSCGWSFIHDTHKCGTGGHDPYCDGYGYSFCPY